MKAEDRAEIRNIVRGVACVAAGFAALFWWLYIGSDATRNPFLTPTVATVTPSSQGSKTTRENWDAVTQTLVRGNIAVEPWDSSAPATLRMHLSPSTSDQITDRKARDLALLTRSRLGDDAIVYVKTTAGQTIAKASPWGVE